MADKSITAANVLASSAAQISEGVAGETITAGQPIFKDTTAAGVLKLSDANVTAKEAVDGIALNGASLGQPIKYATKDASFTPGCTIAAGETVVLSATAGAICPDADIASGSIKIVLMVGIGSNKAILNITKGGLVP